MLEAYTALGALATATERLWAGHAGNRQHLSESESWSAPVGRFSASAHRYILASSPPQPRCASVARALIAVPPPARILKCG